MEISPIICLCYQHRRRRYGNRSDSRRQLNRGRMMNYMGEALSSMEWGRKLMELSCHRELIGKILNILIVIPHVRRAEM
jgi:hypothetical protein